MALVILLLGGLPARAAAVAASGSASGISLNSSLAGSLLEPTPSGVPGTATASQPGFRSSGQAGPIDLAGLVDVGLVTAATQGALHPAGGTGTAASSVSLASLSLVNGLVTAGAVTSTCSASTEASTGSVTLAGVNLGGTSVVDLPGPNTVIDVPGVLHAVVNEQTTTTTRTGTSIRVRALDLQVLPASPSDALLTLVVGAVDCSASGKQAGPVRRPSASPSAAGSPVPIPSPSLSPAPALPTPSAVPPGSSGTAIVPPTPPTPPSLSLSPSSGGPGSLLSAVATGFAGCPRVAILLGGAQIGAGAPSAAGRVQLASLTIPGNALPGEHDVFARCSTSRTRERVASFTVTRLDVHRSAFATSVVTPRQVATSARTVAESLVIAGGFMLMAAFPGELFDSTLEENYVEIRGWFGLGPPKERPTNHLRQLVIFVAFVLLAGILYAALSPDFALNRSTLALAVGVAAALVVTVLVYSLPLLVHVRIQHRRWALIRVLPGTALVAVACVLISRAVHFQPGYLFGLIAGLDWSEMQTDTNGRLTLLAVSLLLAVGIGAWFLRTPVAAAAARPDAGFWLVAADGGLVALFIASIESCVFCLLPLKFLDGKKLTAWRRTAWAAVFVVAVFAFVQLLLQPGSGYVAPASGGAKWAAIALFVGFGLFSVAFWAYFRFRPGRTPPAGAAGAQRPVAR